VTYWESIADNLRNAEWTCGCISAVTSEGRTIWVADAHRGDGKRLVVHADEKLTAFLELEAAVCKKQHWHCLSRPGRITAALSSLGVSPKSSTWPFSPAGVKRERKARSHNERQHMKRRTNIICLATRSFPLGSTVVLIALTSCCIMQPGTAIVFNTLAPDCTYDQNGFSFPDISQGYRPPPQRPSTTSKAAMFTSMTSGNLAKVYLGLTYRRARSPTYSPSRLERSSRRPLTARKTQT